MSKYAPLQRHLSSLDKDEWVATFADIEKILGFKLPASAGRYPAWWANQADGGHSQSLAWQDAGWQTTKVDLGGRRLCFRRTRLRGASYRGATEPMSADQRLFEEAERFSGIGERDALVKEGMRALIEREAARRLAQVGGTMPDFLAPPRQR